MIVGIDEVGRGPWAGPIVFGAVILGDAEITGLTDSKKLSKKRREALDVKIRQQAKAIGLGWVSAKELDTIGMSAVLTLACRRALEQITIPYQQIILDGTVNFLKGTGKGPYVTTMKQADLLVPSVSAASIVAKVARDAYMAEQDTIYPGYNFSAHAGYGTSAHRQSIVAHGVSPLHRRSFAPIAAIVGAESSLSVGTKTAPTTKSVGDAAEHAVTHYLQRNGYDIIARNWKTRACEIDIVARRRGVTHFVEVKYRSRPDQGGGLAAITPKKLIQMRRAATLWMQRHGEANATLSAIEVAGADLEVTVFLENL